LKIAVTLIDRGGSIQQPQRKSTAPCDIQPCASLGITSIIAQQIEHSQFA